jgi:hypothetical protein
LFRDEKKAIMIKGGLDYDTPGDPRISRKRGEYAKINKDDFKN